MQRFNGTAHAINIRAENESFHLFQFYICTNFWLKAYLQKALAYEKRVWVRKV